MLHKAITRVSLICSLALGLTTACVEFEDDIGAAQQAGIGDTGCQPWRCGVNTEIADGFFTGEVNLRGAPNDAGWSIVSVEKSGVEYDLDMVGDVLVAKDSSDTVVFSGSSMVGAIIWLESPAGDAYELHILDFTDTLAYWDHPNDNVAAYHLAYADPEQDDVFHDLCSDPPTPASSTGYETYATLLNGERYNSLAAEVKDARPDDIDWLTFACAGTALSKMKLLRYTPYEPAGSYFTTKAQRQATIKMLIADYCGTGKSFTKSGTDLLWADRKSWASYSPADVDTFEAMWSDRGAVCIDIPRLSYASPGNPTYAEDMLAEIETECALPPMCDPDDLPAGDWATANPK